MKTMILTLAALLAISGPAMAGIEAHGTFGLPDGSTRTVDAYVNDDGTVVILLDGQPLGVPSAPEVPSTPELPSAPEVPSAPELPSAPEVPSAPELPAIPVLP